MATTQSSIEREDLKHASSDEIRDDIRGTRRSMDETLDRLGDRLHPRHLLDDVIDVFRSGGASDAGRMAASGSMRAGRGLADQVREHPLPALLIGAGLVWWMLDRGNGRHDDYDYDQEYAYDPTDPSYSSAHSMTGTRSAGSALGVAIETEASPSEIQHRAWHEEESQPGIMEKSRDAASAVGDKVAGAAHRTGESMSRAGRSMHQMSSHAARRAGQSFSRGGRAVHRASDDVGRRFNHASNEHPLAVGGFFLAAGVIAGLLLPSTHQEDEWMGEYSDELKEDLKTRGQEAVEKGKETMERAAGAALDKAEEHGVTPGNLVEKAGRVASEAISAGKRTAQEKGVTPSSLGQKAKDIAEDATSEVKDPQKSAQQQPSAPYKAL